MTGIEWFENSQSWQKTHLLANRLMDYSAI